MTNDELDRLAAEKIMGYQSSGGRMSRLDEIEKAFIEDEGVSTNNFFWLIDRCRKLEKAAQESLLSQRSLLIELASHVGTQPGKDYLISSYISEDRFYKMIMMVDKIWEEIKND